MKFRALIIFSVGNVHLLENCHFFAPFLFSPELSNFLTHNATENCNDSALNDGNVLINDNDVDDDDGDDISVKHRGHYHTWRSLWAEECFHKPTGQSWSYTVINIEHINLSGCQTNDKASQLLSAWFSCSTKSVDKIGEP